MRILAALLPRPIFDVSAALKIVAYYQQSNQAAYLSHRKRRIARLERLPSFERQEGVFCDSSL